jgi:hypothetical protein
MPAPQQQYRSAETAQLSAAARPSPSRAADPAAGGLTSLLARVVGVAAAARLPCDRPERLLRRCRTPLLPHNSRRWRWHRRGGVCCWRLPSLLLGGRLRPRVLGFPVHWMVWAKLLRASPLQRTRLKTRARLARNPTASQSGFSQFLALHIFPECP